MSVTVRFKMEPIKFTRYVAGGWVSPRNTVKVKNPRIHHYAFLNVHYFMVLF